MTTTQPPPDAEAPDSEPRGQAFYQGLLDDEEREVPVSLRASAPGHLDAVELAPARYFDPTFHQAEVEHVWSRVWQMAGRAEQIPEVGDSLVYEVADLSLVVVRTEPDRIRAFHNSCLHRGTQLRSRPGHLTELRCSYHGFTWSLDGTLRDVPSRWDFPDLVPDELCLPEAQVDTWGGFVFVNPDGDAAPLTEFLGPLPEHFAAWPLEDRRLAAHVVRVMPCNWKVALEAFIEAYHTMAVHPQLLPTAADSLTQYDVFGPHVSRMMTAVGISSEHLDEPLSEAEIVAAMTAGGDDSADGGASGDVPGIPDGATGRQVIAERTFGPRSTRRTGRRLRGRQRRRGARRHRVLRVPQLHALGRASHVVRLPLPTRRCTTPGRRVMDVMKSWTRSPRAGSRPPADPHPPPRPRRGPSPTPPSSGCSGGSSTRTPPRSAGCSAACGRR